MDKQQVLYESCDQEKNIGETERMKEVEGKKQRYRRSETKGRDRGERKTERRDKGPETECGEIEETRPTRRDNRDKQKVRNNGGETNADRQKKERHRLDNFFFFLICLLHFIIKYT
jgi:hypothetical protein